MFLIFFFWHELLVQLYSPMWHMSLSIKQGQDDVPQGRQAEGIALFALTTAAQVHQVETTTTSCHWNMRKK